MIFEKHTQKLIHFEPNIYSCFLKTHLLSGPILSTNTGIRAVDCGMVSYTLTKVKELFHGITFTARESLVQ